jgi:hypothetical protein
VRRAWSGAIACARGGESDDAARAAVVEKETSSRNVRKLLTRPKEHTAAALRENAREDDDACGDANQL